MTKNLVGEPVGLNAFNMQIGSHYMKQVIKLDKRRIRSCDIFVDHPLFGRSSQGFGSGAQELEFNDQRSIVSFLAIETRRSLY